MGKGNIHFIITGGTIDSFYDGTKDTAVPSKDSAIPQFVKGLKLYQKSFFTQVCMKDSRAITKADLNKILKTIDKSPHKKFIVTHGTYTMSDSARYIESKLNGKDKTIIFTGSIIPLVGFSPSDAPFNLGFSIAKLEELNPGIYVCMNARVFTPEEVAKNISEGKFYSVFREEQ